MSFISKAIPNLIDGVSQQPAATRLRTQAEKQENFVSSVVKGLIRRQPTINVAKLLSSDPGDTLVHWIKRDASERYVVLSYGGDTIKVFDLDGTEKTVTNSDSAYLNTLTPSASLRAMTVKDYTFLTNVEITPAMSASTTPGDISQGALVFVKEANYSTDYNINIDGTQQATYSTGASGTLSTDTIASDLASDLSTNLGAGWTITRVAHVILIKKDDGSDFTVQVTDSRANTQLFSVKSAVQRFADLPTVAPDGFVVKVQGGDESNFDDYYVKFTANDATADMDEGVWDETVAPGLEYAFDASTMPHTLIRNGDGTFTFDAATWDDRAAGDADTAPSPSFIGQPVQNFFFYEDRLGMLAGQNVCMSEVGSYFNFWPTTVMTDVDSDRLDVAASDNQVVTLYHAEPHNEKVIFLSQFAQFELSSGTSTGLSARSAKIKPTTNYEVSTAVAPVAAGRMVYFVGPKGQNSAVREYFASPDAVDVKEAPDVAEHVPTYLPDSIVQLEASVNSPFIVALDSADRSILYVYNYFWRGDQKVQSSWHKWTFGGDILGMHFYDDQLYMVVKYSDGVYLEKMSISVGITDTGQTYVTLLDRRITEADCSSVSYDSGTDQTTFTLPYNIGAGTDYTVVTRYHSGGDPDGQELPPVSRTSTTLVVSGDKSSSYVFIGRRFTSLYRFSKQYVNETQQDGKVAITDGTLIITLFNLTFEDTGAFTFKVIPDYGDESEQAFTGRIIGANSNIIGTVALATGNKQFFVGARNDMAAVEITTDSFLPATFQTAAWAGRFHLKSGRIGGA